MKASEFLKRDWLAIIILAIPFIVISLFWDKYPNQIPMHWDFSGNIDKFESKFPGLFFIPVLNIVLYLMFLAIPKIDPKWKNYNLFKKGFQTIKLSLIMVFMFLFMVVTMVSFGMKLDVMYAVIMPITVLMAILGNVMGNLRQNYFIGIRLPWTLNNEQVWNITHRMASHLWVWSSIIMFVLIVHLPSLIIKYVFWIYIAEIVLIPSVYSYIVHQRIVKNEEVIELDK